MRYQCLVCYYDQMLDPPEDFNICPCCGTEFGNDDFDMTHEELRLHWMFSGMNWFSEYTPEPVDWNPYLQLANQKILAERSRDESFVLVEDIGSTKHVIEATPEAYLSGHWTLISTKGDAVPVAA